MALFRLSPASHAAPLVRGEGIYLRPPEIRDFEAWAICGREAARF